KGRTEPQTPVQGGQQRHPPEAASCGERSRAAPHDGPQRRIRPPAGGRPRPHQRPETLQVRDPPDGADLHLRPHGPARLRRP
ncbi:UNVERIFIED_CONTAM: hypothetical protein GTU68_037396, partial [Idotea baltica]|nr:hypothetical protein [Idotea baltica]